MIDFLLLRYSIWSMRTSEALFAKWPVFALAEKVWIVPAEHMKLKDEHRVLSFSFLDFGEEFFRRKSSALFTNNGSVEAVMWFAFGITTTLRLGIRPSSRSTSFFPGSSSPIKASAGILLDRICASFGEGTKLRISAATAGLMQKKQMNLALF